MPCLPALFPHQSCRCVRMDSLRCDGVGSCLCVLWILGRTSDVDRPVVAILLTFFVCSLAVEVPVVQAGTVRKSQSHRMPMSL